VVVPRNPLVAKRCSATSIRCCRRSSPLIRRFPLAGAI
jgi:hypothetical protein